MSLSDFVANNIDRLEKSMRRLSHNTMMGDNGVDETVLIAFGKYRQMKSERDIWIELRKKRDTSESTMEEMPDDEEELPPAEPARRALPKRQARQWGGGQ